MIRRHIPNRHHGRPAISHDNEVLYRDWTVRVIFPEQKDIVWRTHAPMRSGYSEADLDKMLEQVADRLEKQFPTTEFRMVELAPNRFNFIYHGRKESMATAALAASLNGCPEVARSSQVAEKVCAVQGHKLNVYQNGMTNTPQGPQMNTINFCSNCGLSLNEVRGDLDQRINDAVNEGINKRLATAAAGATGLLPAGAHATQQKTAHPIRPDSIPPRSDDPS